MVNIFIIGSGNFGTALAKVFSHSNKVIIYSIDKEAVSNINNLHENKRFLPKIKLNENIFATMDISVAKDCQVIILAVPSSAVLPVCRNLKPYYNTQIIISTSKGISPDGEVLTDLIEKTLHCDKKKVVSLSGPSIAREVALLLPTKVMLGGDNTTTRKLSSMLDNESLIFGLTTDKRGIQLLGFYKNLVAILVGLCDGLGLGANFKASLISKVYNEFYNLNINKNIARHSFIDAAGLGDLYVTDTSLDSRNRRFGMMLAKGKSPKDIKKEIGQVIEGYETLNVLNNLKDKSFVDENLLNLLIGLTSKAHPSEKIKDMLVKYLESSEIKNIIFDWGNVLTLGNYSWRVAGILAGKYKLERKKLFDCLENHEGKALFGEETFKQFYLKVKKHYPMLKYNHFLSTYKKSVTFNLAMLSFCRKLKSRFKLYVLSNNYGIITPILNRSQMKQIFDGVVYSNYVHKIKPHKDIFEYTLNRFNLRAKNCLFVDDCKANVEAAASFRINTLQFKNLNQLKVHLKSSTFL